MPFPSELDPTAVRQVIRFVTGADRDTGRFALALYDLLGFGLGKFFADAKFLADADPADAALVAELTAAIDREKLKELLEKYGPAVVRLLLRLFLKV
jgi:hypothetical protein